MQSPLLVEVNQENGHFLFKEYHVDNFDNVVNPRTVGGFAIDSEEKLLLIQVHGKMWAPPGGKIESGETPIHGLVRELYEEAAIKIDVQTIQPLFYSETYIEEPIGEWKYLGDRLRYACRITQKDKFLADPDEDITGQMYCEIDELPKYVQWGETTEVLIQSLKKYVESTRS